MRLGSFEAGVLFEVLDALAQHNTATPEDEHVYLDVLTGASAGGMTAAIVAQHLLYAQADLADPYNNVLYNAWVVSADIEGLLPLQPTESAEQSVLSSNFVTSLAADCLLRRYNGQRPPREPHPAAPPTGAVQLGFALSNLTGVDYNRNLLSGGTFNYTAFQDQLTLQVDTTTDTDAAWQRIAKTAVACGAFPFAFRPVSLSRSLQEYPASFLAPWPTSPRDFTYTDGGIFQNQPLGMAKNLVDLIDKHQNSETRSYLFVSPRPLDAKVNGITAATCSFKITAGSLVNAVYSQAGFQDWIEAERVNTDVTLLNERAAQLQALIASGGLPTTPLSSLVQLLLGQFSGVHLNDERIRLRQQFASDYATLLARAGSTAADTWLNTVLLLELAADLHEKDEMYIYAITAAARDLAGAGLFSFFGFLSREFRDHDYDLGRKNAQGVLGSLHELSQGKLPRLSYTPKEVHPIMPTPLGGFTAALIPQAKRQKLATALSTAADNALREEGVNVLIRKLIGFYLSGKIRKLLDT